MEEKLYKVSLVISIIGIILIFLFQEEIGFNYNKEQELKFEIVDIKTYDSYTEIQGLSKNNFVIKYFDSFKPETDCIIIKSELETELIANEIKNCE